jgi:hypothetical protein
MNDCFGQLVRRLRPVGLVGHVRHNPRDHPLACTPSKTRTMESISSWPDHHHEGTLATSYLPNPILHHLTIVNSCPVIALLFIVSLVSYTNTAFNLPGVPPSPTPPSPSGTSIADQPDVPPAACPIPTFLLPLVLEGFWRSQGRLLLSQLLDQSILRTRSPISKSHLSSRLLWAIIIQSYSGCRPSTKVTALYLYPLRIISPFYCYPRPSPSPSPFLLRLLHHNHHLLLSNDYSCARRRLQ